MTNISANLRKAAVLLRSLDADTAAMMLGELTPAEAAAIRGAMRALGPVDSDEQADVLAELGRARPPRNAATVGDVELSLSSSFTSDLLGQQDAVRSKASPMNRFEFLDSAPTQSLVPYLSREHAQTIAVVLSHLAPARAAAVLAALPQKLQTDTIDRLTNLGETDPDSVTVLERELEAWVVKRTDARDGSHRRDTMATILAAADPKTRNCILSNMNHHSNAPVRRRAAPIPARSHAPATPIANAYRIQAVKERQAIKNKVLGDKVLNSGTSPAARVLPSVAFDDLIKLDSRALAAVLRQVDANILALALAGSREELVDRICEQMPKRTARDFRRELRRIGPTRLSDVEAAQRAVARIAARQLADRPPTFAAMHS